jgi:hypothetical protein
MDQMRRAMKSAKKYRPRSVGMPDPRYTNPPLIDCPVAWPYSKIGSTSGSTVGGTVCTLSCAPSRLRQP